jgi:Uma2 family endonuclease
MPVQVRQAEEPLAMNRTNGYTTLPPLQSGDQLSRAEFERRYHLHREIKKAELIEGEVYVPSPVLVATHGDPHFDMILWLGVYRANTPGVRGSDNATVRLDQENEPQPDALLRLEPGVGGRSVIGSDGYLEGPPELIVEIAASSASYDLSKKKRVYARNGVLEYVVFQSYEQRVDWFVLQETVYQPLLPDADGVIRSQVFPGLWLDPAAFWAGAISRLLAVLQEGLATANHAAFVSMLETNRTKPN